MAADTQEHKIRAALVCGARGAAGFGFGGLIAAWFADYLPMAGLVPSFGGLWPLIAYGLCGLTGGLVLGIGTRGANGFGCGFVIGGAALFFSLISLQAGSPDYRYAAIASGLGFALAGAIGGGVLGLELALPGACIFGSMGAVLGPLLFFLCWRNGGPIVTGLWDFSALGAHIVPLSVAGGLFGIVVGILGRDRYRD